MPCSVGDFSCAVGSNFGQGWTARAGTAWRGVCLSQKGWGDVNPFILPQQLSSTSWWHVSTVYGIDLLNTLLTIRFPNPCPQPMAAQAVSPSFSSHQLVGSFQIDGSKYAANWQVGHSFGMADGAQICDLTDYTPQKTKWIWKENSWPFPLQNSTVCCRVRDNLWISSFRYSSCSLWLWKSLKVAIVFWGKRSRKYIMTFPDNY